MGTGHALCRKAEIKSLFIGIDAVAYANGWNECHQFPQVWNDPTKFNFVSTCSIDIDRFYSIFREKLPQYDIDISFMFPIDQENCVKNIVKNQTDVEWK